MPRAMPRQNHKLAKPAAMPRLPASVKGSSRLPANGTSLLDYGSLKRTQLQRYCKELGLRASGKNAELVERLKAYHEESQLKTEKNGGKATTKTQTCSLSSGTPGTVPHLTKEVKIEPSEEKTDVVHGWCVVHGMMLYRPRSSWAPLLLHRGSVYVQDGENLTPFRLPSLNVPVPDSFLDNYVCEDCVLRNRERPNRCPCCHQIEKDKRILPSQSCLEGQSPLQYCTSRPSLLATCIVKGKRRTTDIKKLYRPQEDQAYAQRVDGILSQMARGELGMDRALRPLQPLVVHSPAPCDR